MTLLTGWPSITEDSGNGTSGTILSKTTVFDVIKSAIETLIHSTTNPTVTPEDIIDEVVTARGNLASLNARMSGVVDADGNPIAAAGTATTVQLQSQLASLNLAANADLSSWSGGAAAAPDSFTLTGAAATIAKTGAGEADTFTFGAGPYAAKITRAGTDADLTQTVIAAADWSKYEKAEGRMVVIGAWIKTSVASHARLVISDGATETNSSYHTGGGTSEFLTAVHTISSSATKLDFRCEVNSSNGDAYFGGFIFLFSNVAPSAWQYGSNIPLATATLAGIVSTAAQNMGDGIKHFGDPMTFYNGTQSTDKSKVSGIIHRNVTSVAKTGDGTDQALMAAATLAINTLESGTLLRVTMVGKNSGGGAGNRTYKLTAGGQTASFSVISADGTHWRMEAYILVTGTATQVVSATMLSSAGLIDGVKRLDCTVNITSATFSVALTVNGSATNGGTQEGMFIEVLA